MISEYRKNPPHTLQDICRKTGLARLRKFRRYYKAHFRIRQVLRKNKTCYPLDGTLEL